MLVSYQGPFRRTSLILVLVIFSLLAADTSQTLVAATTVTRASSSTSSLFAEYKKIIASDGARPSTASVKSPRSAARPQSSEPAMTMLAAVPSDVFERNRAGGDNWGEVRKLGATDGAAGDRFGDAVDISNDTIVVGAPSDDANRGSVYVFRAQRGWRRKLGPDQENQRVRCDYRRSVWIKCGDRGRHNHRWGTDR